MVSGSQLVAGARHSAASHGLPNSIFWEDRQLEISPKSLILLVGAAGFEPATWSTQNSRATRLRYTPPGRTGNASMPVRKIYVRYTLCSTAATFCGAARSCAPARFPREERGHPCSGNSAPQNRACDPVAGLNAKFPGGPGRHFEHGSHRPAGWNDLVGQGLGVFRNVANAAIALNEDHVQGHVGVTHPHGDLLIALEIEQHTVGFRQRPAKHQSAGALLIRDREFHRKYMNAGLGSNLKRLLLGSARNRRRHDEACRSHDEEHGVGETFNHGHADGRTHVGPLPYRTANRNRRHRRKRFGAETNDPRVSAERANAVRRRGGPPMPSYLWRRGRTAPEQSGPDAVP